MCPSDFRMASTITPRSLRILLSASDFDANSLDADTLNCSIPTSSPMLLVVKSMNWKTCGFSITCAMRLPVMS